jgi:hypothetical protein
MLYVGGRVHVIRSRILDLNGELRCGGEAEHGVDAGGRFKLRSHDLKYFAKIRSSGNRNFTLRGLARRIGRK